MLKTHKFRILFALLLVVFSIACIKLLLTQPVSKTNISIANFHLRSVSGNRPARGSLNYDLYVTENNEHYKIGAEVADCFYYNDFIHNVKPGGLIKLSIEKNNGFSTNDLRLVVSIDADKKNYLAIDCVNNSSAHEKKNLPIFGALGLIIIYILFYFQEMKDLKKRREKRPKVN